MVDGAFSVEIKEQDERTDQAGRKTGAQDTDEDKGLGIGAPCPAKTSEAIRANEVQSWGMALPQGMNPEAVCPCVPIPKH